MAHSQNQTNNFHSEKELIITEDQKKFFEVLERVRFQVEKLFRDLNKLKQEKLKLEQDKQALQARIDELEEILAREVKKSESNERMIIELQQKNDLLKREIDHQVEDRLREKVYGILKVLPELSCLAEKEPQSIHGLMPEHVLSHFLDGLSELFGKINPYPSSKEIIVDKNGYNWVEIMVNDQNHNDISLKYDWGNEKPLQSVKSGQKIRLRLLRHGWQGSNKILVRAVVTSHVENR